MAPRTDPIAEPVGTLVVTVWRDGSRLRRVVSMTASGGQSPPPLARRDAPSDAAVLAFVRDWLKSVRSGAVGSRR